MLEKKSDDAIIQLKDKVRSLCLQNDPSEPLILLTLEELARVSRRQGHADAELYEELARQAKVQQGQLDLAHFCLTTLSGKAGDVITKALSKCLKKQKKTDKSINNPVSDTDTRVPVSHLANLYHQLPSTGYQYPSHIPSAPYGFQYPGQFPGMPMYQSRPYAMGRGAAGRQWRARGACLFCESTEHQVKDCQKMKLAKSK